MFVEMMNLNISRVMPDLKTNRKESGHIFPQFGNTMYYVSPITYIIWLYYAIFFW